MDERRRIRCPACDLGEVTLHFRPAVVTSNLSSTVNGRRARVKKTSAEINEILDSCPSCGKSPQELTRLLKKSESRRPSHQEILRRLQAAGLPTKI